MTPPRPDDDVPREFLAAYVDGELDADSRAAVESWLAEHAEAFAELQAQRDLSPANLGLWERAEPPALSHEQWAKSRSRIEQRLVKSGQPRWRNAVLAVTGLAAAGVAAAIAWVAFGPGEAPRQQAPVSPEYASPAIAPAPRAVASVPGPLTLDPLEGTAVLAIASDDDVILERVPAFPAGWIVAGRHPVTGVIALATEEDFLLSEFAPGRAWPPGGPKTITAPGDAPMIFAQPLR